LTFIERLDPMKFSRKRVLLAAAAVAVVGLSVPAGISTASAAPTHHPVTVTTAVKPTIVLVHGAWADASSFAPVAERLRAAGYTVLDAPNPLRGLAYDASEVTAFVQQRTTGPVVLVGHSYGGAVITDAALGDANIKALVYVDAYAPDLGETVQGLTAAQPGSLLGGPVSTTFNPVQSPNEPTGDYDLYVQDHLFQAAFAASLPAWKTDELADSQMPVTAGAINEPSTTPAWKTLPSYFFIGMQDKVLPPAEQIIMAQRAHGVIVEGNAPHLSMLTDPQPIVSLIRQAAANVH
jgi:pimeloyl-ACP methyl ester carboxylesterase